jgi:uncharacterized protein YrrD
VRKESDLIGLPILSKKDGNKIASIKDVIYSKKKFRVLAFLVSEGGLFREAKVIKFSDVESIGKDAVIVVNDRVIEKAKVIPELDEIINNQKKLSDEEVLTENGESLGLIKDILIDETKGKIIGFILTDGLIQDIKEGRNILPYKNGITFGEDALVINEKLKCEFDKYKEDYKKLLELL